MKDLLCRELDIYYQLEIWDGPYLMGTIKIEKNFGDLSYTYKTGYTAGQNDLLKFLLVKHIAKKTDE